MLRDMMRTKETKQMRNHDIPAVQKWMWAVSVLSP